MTMCSPAWHCYEPHLRSFPSVLPFRVDQSARTIMNIEHLWAELPVRTDDVGYVHRKMYQRLTIRRLSGNTTTTLLGSRQHWYVKSWYSPSALRQDARFLMRYERNHPCPQPPGTTPPHLAESATPTPSP